MLRSILPLLLIVHGNVATADEWGSIGGQIIVEGEIPERIVLIAKDAEIKDKEVCASEEHLAEDLIIDRDYRPYRTGFHYLRLTIEACIPVMFVAVDFISVAGSDDARKKKTCPQSDLVLGNSPCTSLDGFGHE